MQYKSAKFKSLYTDLVAETLPQEIIQRDSGIDVIVNTVNIPEVIQQAYESSPAGCSFCSITSGPEKLLPNKPVITTWYFRRQDYKEIVNLVVQGLIKLKPIVTHIFPLDELSEAFKIRFQNKSESLKVVVTCR